MSQRECNRCVYRYCILMKCQRFVSYKWIEVALLGTLKPLHLILCDSGLKLGRYDCNKKIEKNERINVTWFRCSLLVGCIYLQPVLQTNKNLTAFFKRFVVYFVNIYRKKLFVCIDVISYKMYLVIHSRMW